ncbi:MAG: hypothetical protein DI628_02935 [Blastochloris viridis]|uniref:DUF4124 domain-containing protein n=1 Tax=Blastochloris viridis TaxID=1079 RepID=A0A6N4R3V8_BLAVI|nr:MAG: hypothetical protein DI628_02935 [Blastochloris viridis]
MLNTLKLLFAGMLLSPFLHVSQASACLDGSCGPQKSFRCSDGSLLTNQPTRMTRRDFLAKCGDTESVVKQPRSKNILQHTQPRKASTALRKDIAKPMPTLTYIPIPMARPAELDADVEALVPSPVITVTRSELADVSVTRVKVTILPVLEKPLWPEGFGPDAACGAGYYPSGELITVLIQGCAPYATVTWQAGIPEQNDFLRFNYAAVQISTMPEGCLALIPAVKMPETAEVGYKNRRVHPHFMLTPGYGYLQMDGTVSTSLGYAAGYETIAGNCKSMGFTPYSAPELLALLEGKRPQ